MKNAPSCSASIYVTEFVKKGVIHESDFVTLKRHMYATSFISELLG